MYKIPAIIWQSEAHANIVENLAYGHECVVRQRLRQKATNEGLPPDCWVRFREELQERLAHTQRTLDAQ